MQRFTGTVEPFALVEVGGTIAWLTAIPFTSWPQQSKVDRSLRPAMVNDPDWHGFKAETDRIVDDLMAHYPGASDCKRMLSVVMPGHAIEPHCDEQDHRWLCRVHVPLATNPQSLFVVGGRHHNMVPGIAYRVNTEVTHSVINNGPNPRVHFMFDVVV